MDAHAIAVIRSALRALRSERKRGCADTAHPAGIERLMRSLVGELGSADLPERARESLRRLERDLRGYADLTPERRRPLIDRALSLLAAIAPEAAKAPTRRTSRAPEPPGPLTPDAPVTALTGVGPARAELLARMGVRTVGDLLRHTPSRYDDRRQVLTLRELKHGQSAVVRVRVAGAGRRSSRRRGAAGIVPVESGGVRGELVFFGRPWMIEQLKVGTELLAIGTARVESGKPALAVTECEVIDPDDPGQLGGIVPVYPATDGISQRMIRGLVAQALERCAPPADPLPERLRTRRKLPELTLAVRDLHTPTDPSAARHARHRLAYDELLALQLALARRRQEAREPSPEAVLDAGELTAEFTAALPFAPTAAQERVLAEVTADLAAAAPAHRLVHGEVGSGKTVIAALALAAAARAGRQAAMMAPTELLAEQHHESLRELLAPLGVAPVLLTGGMPTDERRAAQQALAEGWSACAVGTHALFAGAVEFADLAVAVIDEQHRFGVRQRARLSAKGARPNVFVMSATPIPRTLALAVGGDFDISVLDELPPGRRAPETVLLAEERRAIAWEFVRAQVAEGRQAYVVCPAIDESDQGLAAATATFDELAGGPLAELRLGLVHGRLETAERQAIMREFRDAHVDVLVATSLIEVGVNVPNATTIVIEDAERFGLAQLHQLRGRVARAGWQPHCLLISGSDNPEALERLAVLVRTSDGFEIAEEDLRRRGPGELDGVRQSGLPDLHLASIIADTAALADARADAFELIEADPDLARAEHAGLRGLLERATSGDAWTL